MKSAHLLPLLALAFAEDNQVAAPDQAECCPYAGCPKPIIFLTETVTCIETSIALIPMSMYYTSIVTVMQTMTECVTTYPTLTETSTKTVWVLPTAKALCPPETMTGDMGDGDAADAEDAPESTPSQSSPDMDTADVSGAGEKAENRRPWRGRPRRRWDGRRRRWTFRRRWTTFGRRWTFNRLASDRFRPRRCWNPRLRRWILCGRRW